MNTRRYRLRPAAAAVRMPLTALLLAGLSIAVAACSGGGLLGQEKKRAPDEFAVYSRAPLSLPPGYNLRPPEPGAQAIDPSGPRAEARSALLGEAPTTGGWGSAPYDTASAFGGDDDPMISVPGDFADGAAGTAATPGVQSILASTGGMDADPAIRDLVNRETAILAEEDRTFVERLIFWGTPTEYGTVVDPIEERRRIKENQALGRTVTAGTTPTIERKRRALLEGIFD